MRRFLQRCIRQTFLPMLMIASTYPASVLAEMVSCPASLTWYFSGYCARKMLPNEGKCPAPSRMEKSLWLARLYVFLKVDAWVEELQTQREFVLKLQPSWNKTAVLNKKTSFN